MMTSPIGDGRFTAEGSDSDPVLKTTPVRLSERARQRDAGTCLIEADTGRSFTYRRLHLEAQRLGRWFRELGVDSNDTVATMLPHSFDTYRVWFGLAELHALDVPISTRYKGRMLEHIISDSEAKVLVIDGKFLEELQKVMEDSPPPSLEKVVVRGTGEPGANLANIDRLALPDAAGDLGNIPDEEAASDGPGPHDLAMVLYTSGTTGPSKGVLVPWGQVHATITGVYPDGTLEPGSVLYAPFPANHIGGRLFPCLGIEEGVPVVVRDTFSASAYWTDISSYGCTTTALVPAMASILWNAPKADDDIDTPLRDVLMVPIIPEYEEFQQRFGVRVCTDYNMTELSVPTHSGWHVDDWRSCGRVREGFPGYELRVVDEHDYPVGVGEVGELVCRTDAPWALNAGYLGRPEETAAAWRNGWFHTGDAFKVDAQGRFYFVDRIKDAIRRRGENVSSFEVEQELLDHPDVVDCAAIGIPSELGEEDIKVFVVKKDDSALTPEELIEYSANKSPDFMVPRYIEFVGSLPYTEATLKVKKSELRRQEADRRGTPDTASPIDGIPSATLEKERSR